MPNKSVSLNFFETYGQQHDVEGCAPLFAEQAVIFTTAAGPVKLDFSSYMQIGHAFLAGFADLDVTVVEQIEDGDKVVSRVLWRGTHTGDLKGIPATGRSFQSEAIFIDTFENGKIIERREISDMLGMMQQLGIIPVPQGA